jgi:hypothetical protein
MRNRDLKLELIDETARRWDKTKNPKTKKLWYKLVKEYADEIKRPTSNTRKIY